MNQNTAILIFTNSADKEAERKSFLSVNILSKLNRQILKKVVKTKLPFFVISDEKQVGDSFGERFTNAIESIFKKGFQNIIAVGNDTPHLKTKHLLEANYQLEKKNTVLGPSKDGGFYLLGITKSLFNKQSFLSLPWQTSSLQKVFSKKISKNVNTYCLHTFSDIDNLQDVKNIINSYFTINKDIKKLLMCLIYITKKNNPKTNFIIPNLIQNLFLNRGSPVV